MKSDILKRAAVEVYKQRKKVGAGVVVLLIIVAGVFVFKIPLSHFLWAKFHLSKPALLLNRDAELALDIGLYYFRWGGVGEYDLERAAYYFHEALEIDPHISGAQYQLGRIHFLNGNFFSAIFWLDRQLKQHADQNDQFFMSTHYMRGLTLGFMKRFSEAEKEFQDLLIWNGNDTNWAVYNDLAWIYFQQGTYEKTAVVAERGLNFYPDNVWLLTMYGTALLNLGDHKTAKATLERALMEAGKLTEADWQRAYPGNDPRVSEQGLAEIIDAITANLAIVNK